MRHIVILQVAIIEAKRAIIVVRQMFSASTESAPLNNGSTQYTGLRPDVSSINVRVEGQSTASSWTRPWTWFQTSKPTTPSS